MEIGITLNSKKMKNNRRDFVFIARRTHVDRMIFSKTCALANSRLFPDTIVCTSNQIVNKVNK